MNETDKTEELTMFEKRIERAEKTCLFFIFEMYKAIRFEMHS